MLFLELATTLLNYFVQQSVSHGLMFFSGILAFVTFFSSLRKKNLDSNSKKLTAMIVCCILLAFSTYALGRILVYGIHSYSAISLPENVTINLNNQYYNRSNAPDLHVYNQLVRVHSLNRPKGDFYQLILMIFGHEEQYRLSQSLGIHWSLVLSLGIGGIISSLLLLGSDFLNWRQSFVAIGGIFLVTGLIGISSEALKHQQEFVLLVLFGIIMSIIGLFKFMKDAHHNLERKNGYMGLLQRLISNSRSIVRMITDNARIKFLFNLIYFFILIPLTSIMIYGVFVNQQFVQAIIRDNALNLLNAIINIDGILLGFMAIIYAGILQSIQSQANIWNMKQLDRISGVKEECDKALNVLDNYRRNIFLLLIGIIGSLLFSILYTFFLIANVGENLQSSWLFFSIIPIILSMFLFLSVVDYYPVKVQT